MNGADQLVLFGSDYKKLAMVAILFGSFCFLYADFHEGKGTPTRWRFRTPLELWALLLFAAAMIPELIQLPLYPEPVAFPVSRLTSISQMPTGLATRRRSRAASVTRRPTEPR